MEADYIKKIMNEFADNRMNLLDMSIGDIRQEHSFRKTYCKKRKALFQNEKYFGEHIAFGNFIRRAAMVLIIVLSLVAVNGISARVFGFNPWKTTIRSLGDVLEVRYHGRKEETLNQDGLAKRIYDLPQYIPEGYETDVSEVTKEARMALWENKEKDSIGYSAIMINETLVGLQNAEYKSKENV